MKKFEELTMGELKALYDEKVKQEKITQEEVKKERPKRWRAEDDEHYWYVDNDGCIMSSVDIDDDDDKYNYSIGNYFKTQKQAEEYKKKLILQQEYKDWCAFDCDWNNEEQEKFYAIYHNSELEIVFTITVKKQGATYAQSKERIREFIDKIGEEDFIKYVLEVEE